MTSPLPDLTAELVQQYGDLLPSTLITRTVAAAAAAPSEPYPDEPTGAGDVERTARHDVRALAEAVRRSAGGV
jgi:hypothetical protein